MDGPLSSLTRAPDSKAVLPLSSSRSTPPGTASSVKATPSDVRSRNKKSSSSLSHRRGGGVRLSLQPLKIIADSTVTGISEDAAAAAPPTPSSRVSMTSSPPNLLALSQLYQERNRRQLLNLSDHQADHHHHDHNDQMVRQVPRKLEPMHNQVAPSVRSSAVEESHNKWLLNSRSIDSAQDPQSVGGGDPFGPSSRRPLYASVNFPAAAGIDSSDQAQTTNSSHQQSLEPIPQRSSLLQGEMEKD